VGCGVGAAAVGGVVGAAAAAAAAGEICGSASCPPWHGGEQTPGVCGVERKWWWSLLHGVEAYQS